MLKGLNEGRSVMQTTTFTIIKHKSPHVKIAATNNFDT